MAHLAITHGRPVSSRLRYGALSCARLVGEQAHFAFDAGRFQFVDAAAVDRRKRIFHRGDDAATPAMISAFVQGGVLP